MEVKSAGARLLLADFRPPTKQQNYYTVRENLQGQNIKRTRRTDDTAQSKLDAHSVALQSLICFSKSVRLDQEFRKIIMSN